MPSLLLPIIWYPSTVLGYVRPPGSPAQSSLQFTYPPRQVPENMYSAVRHDNVAASGVRETVYVRTDTFFAFTMEYVKIGSDVEAWDAFMQSALQGLAFDYFPDSTNDSTSSPHTVYLLEDASWTSAYKQLGMYTFKCKFRARVSWP